MSEGVSGPRPTPGQTIGPFFGPALVRPGGELLVPLGTPGALRLHGSVLDGHGDPVPDCLLEVWQAAPDGRVIAEPGSLRRDGYTFTGWGRAATDDAGHWSFTTLEPGPTEPGQPPFFALTVFARGLLDRLFTRVYLPGAGSTGGTDPLLAGLTTDLRDRMLARRDGPAALRFDVHLRGERETVFLRYAADSPAGAQVGRA
jgi:protocatechuate 3,4-dioxygenase alpha subunit